MTLGPHLEHMPCSIYVPYLAYPNQPLYLLHPSGNHARDFPTIPLQVVRAVLQVVSHQLMWNLTGGSWKTIILLKEHVIQFSKSGSEWPKGPSLLQEGLE